MAILSALSLFFMAASLIALVNTCGFAWFIIAIFSMASFVYTTLRVYRVKSSRAMPIAIFVFTICMVFSCVFMTVGRNMGYKSAIMDAVPYAVSDGYNIEFGGEVHHYE